MCVCVWYVYMHTQLHQLHHTTFFSTDKSFSEGTTPFTRSQRHWQWQSEGMEACTVTLSAYPILLHLQWLSEFCAWWHYFRWVTVWTYPRSDTNSASEPGYLFVFFLEGCVIITEFIPPAQLWTMNNSYPVIRACCTESESGPLQVECTSVLSTRYCIHYTVNSHGSQCFHCSTFSSTAIPLLLFLVLVVVVLHMYWF